MSVGKVLVIDEAIGLYNGARNGSAGYGKQVLDTIVEKVSGTPGEDRAVIMIGYELNMMEMIRNSNPGLSRRFDVNNPFRFVDYNNDELAAVTSKLLRNRNAKVSMNVFKCIIDKVSMQRTLPNFGNIGTVEVLLMNALQRMKHRSGDVLTEDDVHGYDAATKIRMVNPMSILDDLEEVGTIKQTLSDLHRNIRVAKAQGRPTNGFVDNFVFLGMLICAIIYNISCIICICIIS